MSGAVCTHRNPRYLLIYHAFKLQIYVFHEESNSFTYLSLIPTFIRVILFVAKKARFVRSTDYVLDSLLKHQLTIDNTFALIRSCSNEVNKVENSRKYT